MGRSWSEKLFADLSTGKKLVPRVPVRPLNEPCKTDGIRNPKRAESYASYASIAAAGKRRNDDEEKSPLSTLLPATPERQQKKGLAIQAENLKVDRKQKKQKTDPTPTKIKQQKAKTSSPLHDEWCCNCTKHSKCKTSRCECYQKQRACTSGKCRDGCCERIGLKKLTEPPNRAKSTASDDDRNATPDLTPETVEEPEPTTPINLFDEADENTATAIPESYRRIAAVYGSTLQDDDGTQLDGGIRDDLIWQGYHRRLVTLTPQLYTCPGKAAGKEFIHQLCEEFNGVLERKWNSERPLVFCLAMLQKKPGITQSSDIQKCLKHRLEEWKSDKHKALVETTERLMLAAMKNSQGGTTQEERLKKYNQLMLLGNPRSAVRYLTDREGGGVLEPHIPSGKGDQTVEEALKSKHPATRKPGEDAFQLYENIPELLNLDLNDKTVEKVARRLSGGAGLGGVNSAFLKQILLRHGAASRRIRRTMASFAEWMANSYPPWAAYRALRMGRLIALDKSPGVRPVGIGEIWSRLIAKVILVEAGPEAKNACGDNQLCAGLEAGIEGGIHAVNQVWKEIEQEENNGFLLVDARNAFNELSRAAMLWTIRHEWPSGARFVFNCYKRWAILGIRGQNGSFLVIHSKEGVTQGDPLAMFAYGIGVLPLIRRLKRSHPNLFQPWYADDAGAGGSFTDIRSMFEELQKIGPAYGYFPEPSKSILVVPPAMVERAKEYFRDLHFKVTTGSRYLGGFVGTRSSCEEYVQGKVLSWETSIKDLSQAGEKYPQSTYVGLQKCLQNEWQFLHRVIPDIGNLFAPIEDALNKHFFPALAGKVDISEIPRKLFALPVKFAGMAIPNPITSAETNYRDSTLVCSHLIRALRGQEAFSPSKHRETRTAVIQACNDRKLEEYESTFTEISRRWDVLKKRTITRGKETGTWLTILPTFVNGTELSNHEWRDSFLLRYSLSPLGLPLKCDGCGVDFSINHALKCKYGGLIILRHDEVTRELIELGTMALRPAAVRDEPLITPVPRQHPTQTNNPNSTNNQPVDDPSNDGDRGDILLRGLWKNQHETIIDIRVTDTDQHAYRHQNPYDVLKKQEKEKKAKYLKACLDQRRSFVPFVVSTDGLIGREGKNLLKQIALRLTAKWEQPYSVVRGFVNARINLAILRATNLCIRGSRVPASRMSKKVQWLDGAGLGLFETL